MMSLTTLCLFMEWDPEYIWILSHGNIFGINVILGTITLTLLVIKFSLKSQSNNDRFFNVNFYEFYTLQMSLDNINEMILP